MPAQSPTTAPQSGTGTESRPAAHSGSVAPPRTGHAPSTGPGGGSDRARRSAPPSARNGWSEPGAASVLTPHQPVTEHQPVPPYQPVTAHQPVAPHQALTPQQALASVYRQLGEAFTALAEDGLTQPTRCTGWTAGDLLRHLLADAERALAGVRTPTDDPATATFASYWDTLPSATDSGPGDDGPGDAAADGAATDSGATDVVAAALLLRWFDVASAAVRAVADAPIDGRVRSRGQVLAVPDFVTTLVVEAAVHYLDLSVALPGPAPLSADAAALAHATLAARLRGAAAPVGWHDELYILKCTGRLPLTPRERITLATAADRFPLLG